MLQTGKVTRCHGTQCRHRALLFVFSSGSAAIGRGISDHARRMARVVMGPEMPRWHSTRPGLAPEARGRSGAPPSSVGFLLKTGGACAWGQLLLGWAPEASCNPAEGSSAAACACLPALSPCRTGCSALAPHVRWHSRSPGWHVAMWPVLSAAGWQRADRALLFWPGL